ncbi:MAG: 3-oxoacyl-ACP synthase, partial [Bacteroidales bacterium]|nr:3-oxoacyl-ACP synthase [Bacteroidales bacterium]
MGCKIDAIEIFLPEKVLTNEELVHHLPGWEAGDIYDKIGIRQRHVTAEKETALDIGE